MGFTRPRSVISPVIATFLRTGIFINALAMLALIALKSAWQAWNTAAQPAGAAEPAVPNVHW